MDLTYDAGAAGNDAAQGGTVLTNSYGPERVVDLANGLALRCPAPPAACDYVRVTDASGAETGYWHYDEWERDPKGVMGALMASAQGVAIGRIEGESGDEDGDEDDTHIVVTGDPVQGLFFRGTFESKEAAEKWGRDDYGLPGWWVARLERPTGEAGEEGYDPDGRDILVIGRTDRGLRFVGPFFSAGHTFEYGEEIKGEPWMQTQLTFLDDDDVDDEDDEA